MFLFSTKKFIKDSFIELLKKKNISKISVKEICDNADVNRTTFYNYYEDQYDLLSQIEDEFIDNINITLNKYDFFDGTNFNMEEMLIEILDYMKKNNALFLSLFQSYDINFIKRIVEILGKPFIIMIQKEKRFNQKEAEYELCYTIYGILNVIRQWLLNDKKTSSKELANIIFKICNYKS